MFKRREKRTWPEAIRSFLWPRGGWGRAVNYMKLRLWRLPDSPAKISRGIWAGVFVTFSPFYGLHFFCAAIVAWLMRGNILASLIATFIGNPLTFPLIAVVSLETGYFLLGHRPSDDGGTIGESFGTAWRELKANFWALFSEAEAQWAGLIDFYWEVFFPYMVGGLIPGVLVASICYVFSIQLIGAYQDRRRERLREKLTQLKPSGPAQAPQGSAQDD